MDFNSLFPLISFFLFIFMVAQHMKKRSKLPPGPWQLPLIGNLHQLAFGLPHHTLKSLATKYGPLMYLRLGEVKTIVVTSPEIAKEVMRTHDLVFAYRPLVMATRIFTYNVKDIIFSPYGSYWRQMRKICIVELLSSKRVESFRPVRDEEVMNVIKSIPIGTPFNISRKIFSMTYTITARSAFGKKSEDQERFVRFVEKTTKLASGFTILNMFPSLKVLEWFSGLKFEIERMHKTMDEILEKIIKDRRERKRSGEKSEGEAEILVDVLLRIQEKDDLDAPLSDDHIKAVVADIFSAGSETSSTTVEWAMSELLRHPKAMRRAQEEVREAFGKRGNVDERGLHELKYFNTVISETLRLHPSAPLLVPRQANEQCEINGYTIPAKATLMVNGWAISRDPNYWHDAEKFYPDRFIENEEIDFKGTHFEFIPFGAGRRICPGMWFAVANISLPLAQFLFHFDWKVYGGTNEDLGMEEGFGLTVRRKHDLQLIACLYDGSCLN